MATVRAFVGVGLDEGLRDRLRVSAEALRAELPERGVRWVAGAGLHLTLRFLGDVEAPRLEALGAALAEIRSVAPFQARFGGLSALPHGRRPNVLVVDLVPCDELMQLVRSVEQVAVDHGFPAESRAYRPHITLARVRRGIRLAEPLPEIDLRGAVLRVEAFTLFRSELRREGARYTTLRSFDLPKERRMAQDGSCEDAEAMGRS